MSETSAWVLFGILLAGLLGAFYLTYRHGKYALMLIVGVVYCTAALVGTLTIGYAYG